MNDFEIAAMRRHEDLMKIHPIHSKRDIPPRPTTRIIPVYEKIAMLEARKDCYREARDDYQAGMDYCEAELAIYRDEE